MAYCPFCKRDVPERLVLHGGTCPHCFGDIPGEETPTDPGEQVKEQIRRETEASARSRALKPVLALLPVAVLMLSTFAWFLWPVEVQELDIGDIAINLDFESFDAPAGAGGTIVKPTGSKRADAGKQPDKIEPGTRPPPDARNLQLDGPGSPTGPGAVATEYQPDKARQIGGATPPPGSRVQPGLGDALPTDGASPFNDLSPTASRGNPELTNDSDITRALKDTISARKGRLKQCYEQSLKADETLGGQWKVSMVIQKDGSFSKVAVKPVNHPSAAFEACVRDQVATWSVKGTLQSERSLTFPLNFGAN